MVCDWTISGGTVLGPEGFAATELHVADGRIAGARPPGAARHDATGAWVLPGIVDLHGDAFEAIAQPRPGVHMPYGLAFAEADAQMIANGITTAYHGLTVSWEPGLRDIGVTRRLRDALEAAGPALSCDTRLNIRWETFALDHVGEVLGWLDRRPGDILSINDHTTANHKLGTDSNKLKRMAARMGLTPEGAKTEIDRTWERRDEVPAATDRICRDALAMGRTLLSHDDATPEDRAAGRARGVTVAEFPLSEAAARAAREAGEHVILGGPNALRGESHNGALCATGAIRDGLCTVLASDYYYPSPLHAALRLHDAGILPLEKGWRLVSSNPAAAVGLDDRGTLVPGQRADMLVVDRETRKVRAAFVNGRKVLARD